MIPLIVRSHYSLMQGTCSPEKICIAAKKLGYSRLALTDINNLYGLRPFLNACKDVNIIPIVGAEITDLSSGLRAVCLVENQEGYRNLCRLITARHCKKSFDLKSELTGHAKGLVILTRSETLLRNLHEADVTVAAAASCKPDSAAFKLRKTAKSIGVPMVATPDSFFTVPDDFHIHRMLRAIDLNTITDRLSKTDTAHPHAWPASPAVYKKRFDIWPDTINATYEISERLTFT
ncbi:MAG: PHP domain-containing protein, partial [Deltaproteobacteria bacterium]|nr:PHP domain-containing protein [Deltaproteobacteria bacterium]